MIDPQQALKQLKEGNRRFASGEAQGLASGQAVDNLPTGAQRPFAIILGCSDSRVPVEIIFDQGLGDLFVIRVAGNVVWPSQVGSIEFAAENFGSRLVVVLGHSGCGAVQATLDQLALDQELRSPNLAAIVNRIRPAVIDLVHQDSDTANDELMNDAVRANIMAAVESLKTGSEILESLVAEDKLLVVGAEYSLSTGEVRFLEPES